jgi:4-deoxy-L-threo-5-hexosulose-uronate ketol-isomerase
MAMCLWSTADGWHAIEVTEYSPAMDALCRSVCCVISDGRLPSAVTLRHLDLDRVVLGGAVPAGAPLTLEPAASMAAEYFAERREAGILNIGASGAITVDGRRHAMNKRDVLYVGRGSKSIVLESDDATRPARFYIVSYPAHASHPTTHIDSAAATATDLGTTERANCRRLSKYIHPGGVQARNS